jgi:hypothetical protein
MSSNTVNVRCYTRKDGEKLEALLSNLQNRGDHNILKVTNMGSMVYIHVQPSLEQVLKKVGAING